MALLHHRVNRSTKMDRLASSDHCHEEKGCKKHREGVGTGFPMFVQIGFVKVLSKLWAELSRTDEEVSFKSYGR